MVGIHDGFQQQTLGRRSVSDEWRCQLIKLPPVCNGRTWAGRETQKYSLID